MQCISPLTIRNPKKGIDPQFITVPCGKCGFCLQNRRKEWSFRLWEEFKTATSADFLTLTYNEENVPWADDKMSLDRKRLHKFLKAINDKQRYEGAPLMRYYATGEYGTLTERPHYHIIAFNITAETRNELMKLWPEGNIYRRNVGVESIEYVTKYLIDSDEDYEGREKPSSCMSKRPGLGVKYIARTGEWNYREGMNPSDARMYALWKGKKHRLPRVFKDKIFPPWVKEIQSMKAQADSDQREEREIERLVKFMEDPEHYMEECKRRDLMQIRIKSKSKNTL